MATGTDYRKLWERYQQEGISKNISIVRFCQMNGVVYNHFENWYKRYHRSSVIPVELVDEEPQEIGQIIPIQPMATASESRQTGIQIQNVDIILSNGLSLSHHDLTFAQLNSLISKLEGLC